MLYENKLKIYKNHEFRLDNDLHDFISNSIDYNTNIIKYLLDSYNNYISNNKNIICIFNYMNIIINHIFFTINPLYNNHFIITQLFEFINFIKNDIITDNFTDEEKNIFDILQNIKSNIF